MDTKLQRALVRAKQLLGEEPKKPEPPTKLLEEFDKVVAEARSYLMSNETNIAEDVKMEVKFSKDDFEVSFERG